jgi:hypothetical protein
MGSREQLDNRV